MCGPYSEVAFTENIGAGSFRGLLTFAWSSESYIFNTDISASTSPLIKGVEMGPITRYYVTDFDAYWPDFMLGTTMFDQPECAGRTSQIIDPDTVFRSVILAERTELTLVYEDGASYNLVNNDTSPSCEALPDAKLKEFTYAKELY